jgi:TRAP-type C4-dicarboxylate transport system substrate-binding protein
MAKDKWNKLPAAVQKLLDDNSGETLARAYGVANDAEFEAGRKLALAGKNQTVIVPTPEQDQEYQRKLAPVADDWVKENPDGAAVLAKFRELLSQAKAEVGKK